MEKIRVLIVEDERIVQRLCQRLLRHLDCELIFSDTVKVAIKTIHDGGVDLLITDLKLLDGTGVDVIRPFKEKFRDKQVIVMTGSITPEESLSQAAYFGVSRFLLKPFDIEEFKRVVTSVVHELAA